MKRGTKVALGVIGLVVLGGSAAAVALRGNDDSDGPRTVEVVRGDIVQKALAVGNIEPDVEVGVKSQISGVVRELFVEDGRFVKRGEPLIEVKPNPTPLELADAKRQVELRRIELDNERKSLNRKQELRSRDLHHAGKSSSWRSGEYEQSAIQVQMAEERVALLETGRVRIADRIHRDGHSLADRRFSCSRRPSKSVTRSFPSATSRKEPYSYSWPR